MLGKEIIRKELTRVDIDAKTPIALFECMGKTFLEMGYVNDKYVPSIISREKEYPTPLRFLTQKPMQSLSLSLLQFV